MGYRLIQAALIVAMFAPPACPASRTKQYRADLDAFFKEVDSSYPFFDLKGIRGDWQRCKKMLAAKAAKCRSDAAFIGLLREAVDCLRDAHTGLAETKVKPQPSPREYYPGVSFIAATKRRVCVMVPPVNRLLAKRLVPGTVITKIDGKRARQWLDAQAQALWKKGGPFSSPQRARLFTYRIPFRGKRGEPHRITFTDGRRPATATLTNTIAARGWPHTYAMPAGLQAHGQVRYGKLPSGCGYIQLRGMDQNLRAGFDAALQHIGGAKGLIVDLRGNGGGGYDGEIYKRFDKRAGPTQGIPHWGGKVVVLLDAGCISAGETFARDLFYRAGARLMGQPTAGSSTAKKTWALPSGLAQIRMSTRSRGGINRLPIEFHGIKPQTLVEVDPEELRRGVNSGVRRAEECLLKE